MELVGTYGQMDLSQRTKGTDMNLCLQKLDSHRVLPLLKDKVERMGLLPTTILSRNFISHGCFYAIIPSGMNKEHWYKFDIGGIAVPFEGHTGKNPTPSHNIGRKLLEKYFYELLRTNHNMCLALEDFSSEPNFDYIKNSDRKYRIYSNHLFYVLSGQDSEKELEKYMKYSDSWLSLGALISMPNYMYEKISRNSKQKLSIEEEMSLKSVILFYMEIYDGESFLLWVKKSHEDPLVHMDFLMRNMLG